MKNVREIPGFYDDQPMGAIEATEFGAILEVNQTTGEGEIRYQGSTYHATATQVDTYIHLPQVKHMRQPFGGVTFYQDDDFRAKHL